MVELVLRKLNRISLQIQGMLIVKSGFGLIRILEMLLDKDSNALPIRMCRRVLTIRIAAFFSSIVISLHSIAASCGVERGPVKLPAVPVTISFVPNTHIFAG